MKKIDDRILFRKQGNSKNCPIDGSVMDSQSITLSFIDSSSADYEIQCCSRCRCRFIWIANRFCDVISNYEIADISSYDKNRGRADKTKKVIKKQPKKIAPFNENTSSVLFELSGTQTKCPVDQRQLQAITITKRRENGFPITYTIHKCLHCERRFIYSAYVNEYTKSDYTISGKYKKKEPRRKHRMPVRIESVTKRIADNRTSSVTRTTSYSLKNNTESVTETSNNRTNNGFPTEHSIDSSLPRSSIMTVIFNTPFLHKEQYTIVKEPLDQNVKKGVYSWNTSFARDILKSVFFRIPHQPSIKKVISHQLYQQCKNNLLHFCSMNAPALITLYRRKIAASSDNIENVTAFLFFSNKKEPVPVSVFYSRRTQQYYINEATYREFASKYGLPYVHIQSEESSQTLGWNLRTHSELNLLGYSVGQNNGISMEQRHRLLGQLMDSGLMSKSSIMDHLEWLISTRSKNPAMSLACKAWSDDLRFVAQYNMHNQRMVWGQLVYNAPTRYRYK